MTGLLHISDRLLAGELSRVEAARGALHPLSNVIHFIFYTISLVINVEYFVANFFLAIRKLVWYHLPALVSKYWREVASALHRNTEN